MKRRIINKKETDEGMWWNWKNWVLMSEKYVSIFPPHPLWGV